MDRRLPLGGLGRPSTWVSLLRWLWSRLFGAAGARDARRGDVETRVRLAANLADQPARVTALVLRSRRAWTPTGITLEAGDSLTLLSRGELWLSKSLGVGVQASSALWWRVGTGPAHSMRGQADSIRATTAGEVQLLVAEPGTVTESGDLDDAVRSLPLRGEIEVVIVDWQHDEATALQAVARVDPELFASSHLRARHPSPPPPGWAYHPRIGEGHLFWQPSAEEPIHCLTHRNVGILRRPVELDLCDDLVVSWSWCVEQLPSRIAEDLEPTHDYLAVALEFDDGRDLSWMWSASLAEGTGFRCPLAYWNTRETHVVVRSGTSDLGTWVSERRHVQRDVDRYLLRPRPERVVAAWLVANTAIQGGTAAFRLRDLQLTSAGFASPIDLCATPERTLI